MTLEELDIRGCNTVEGLSRCMNNEAFYLKMVEKFFDDRSKLDALGETIRAGDTDAAFEHAHALKGVCANLALTPLLEKLSDITELLRSKADADYESLFDDIEECFNMFCK